MMKKLSIHQLKWTSIFLFMAVGGFFMGSMNWISSPISTQQIIETKPQQNHTPKSSAPGYIEETGSSIFWFVHITDSQHMWYSEGRKAWAREFLTNYTNIIDPAFIVNTGDLVDSDYSGFFNVHNGQRAEEWQTYSQILNETGMNSSIYYDMLGNHDVYGDPSLSYYQNYSMQKKAQYDFTVNTTQGKYHFLALSMTENTGIKYPFSLFGDLSITDLNWYENSLKQNTDAQMTIIMGHMPAYEVCNGFTRFFNLNREYGVDLYLTGHGHKDDWQRIDNRMVSYETNYFTDSYRIMAIDNNIISTSVQYPGQWPIGVITSPTDTHNVYADLNETKISQVSEVHVLAWDPTGIQKVEWRVTLDKDKKDSWSNWLPMTQSQGALYKAAWNTAIVDGDDHLIQARITNMNNQSKIEEIEYRSIRKFAFGWWVWRPMIIIGAIVVVMVPPITKYALRKSGRKEPKSDYEKVDPKLRKILLLKLLFITILPMTFAAFWPGEVAALFGIFYWRASGLLVTDINLMIYAVYSLLGVLVPAAFLSPRRKIWMLLYLIPCSIGLNLFVLFLLVKTLGIISLIAPGIYAVFISDGLIIKREFALIKQQHRSENQEK